MRNCARKSGQLTIEALVAIAAFLALLAALIGAAAVAGDATASASDAMANERLEAAAVLENEIVAGEGIEFAVEEGFGVGADNAEGRGG